MSQHALLADYEAAQRRQHLVLNIGDAELASAPMLLEHECALFKFNMWDATTCTATLINMCDDESAHIMCVKQYFVCASLASLRSCFSIRC